uniref:WAP domain-containing protein n=1 Tax=Xenopus tropicalis TaxID=8364 RepID=A0A6I8QVR3_XENTR
TKASSLLITCFIIVTCYFTWMTSCGKRGHCPVVPSGNNVTLDSCNTTCPGGKCCNVTCGMKCVNPIYITKKPKCYLLLVNDNNALQCCLWVYGWIKGLLIL